MKVSIIVSLFNARNFIGKCINSILNQTYSNFELIIIDDGSTDAGSQVVRQFMRYDPRIQLIVNPENIGLGGSRNIGVEKAAGEYLTFVDIDDHVDQNYLETLVEATEGGNFDIVVSGCHFIDDEGNISRQYVPAPVIIEELGARDDGFLLIEELGVTQKLFRRKLFTANDIKFPEIYWEDLAVTPVLFASAKNLTLIDYAGYHYLQHGLSITNTLSVKHLIGMVSAFEHAVKLFRRSNKFSKYERSFADYVEKITSYFLERWRHQCSGGTDADRKLFAACQATTQAYAADRTVFERLSMTELESALNAYVAGTKGQTDTEATEVSSLLASVLEVEHAQRGG